MNDRPSDHVDEFTDLLGAYALDAVDPDERDAIEEHLATCPRCRAEVQEHREVAAFLSQGAPAPDGVWDRIEAELSPPAPPMRVTIAPEPPEASVTPIRRSVRARTLAFALAAAAVVVVVLGVVTVGQTRRLDRMEAAVRDDTLEGMALRAAADAPVQVRLRGDDVSARAVVGDDGNGFLITSDLPRPGPGNVYQLWGQVDDQVLSLGTFDQASSVVPFSLDADRLGGVQAFMVTEEKAPGVVTSTQDPVAFGEP